MAGSACPDAGTRCGDDLAARRLLSTSAYSVRDTDRAAEKIPYRSGEVNSG
jgi:hypothetical protein